MKKEENIRQIDFSKLHQLFHTTNTYPDRVAIFNSIAELGLGNYPNRVHAAVLSICLSGYLKLEINLKTYEVNKGMAMVVTPNQIIQIQEISNDFKCLFIAISQDLIEEITYKVENLTQFILIAKENGLLQLEKNEFEHLIHSYEFIKNKFEYDSENKFHEKVLEHQIISIFYECYGLFLKKIKSINKQSSRKETLFNDFIKLVIENHRKEHSTSFYANKLCVSGKYLSAVVEAVSSKSAKRWIDEYIILNSKVLLKSSDKTIQEIANELSFPDASFFGKYFKRIVKISPKEYRMSR